MHLMALAGTPSISIRTQRQNLGFILIDEDFSSPIRSSFSDTFGLSWERSILVTNA